MSRGIFIALEGGEGSGKSTQAERLRERFLIEGHNAVLLREPGTTPLGNHLRSYLKSKRPLSLRAETMLFTAARAQLVEDMIEPLLARGNNVICDRFMASTTAYQGYGRRGDISMIDTLNRYATGGLEPALTILLDISPEDGLARVGKPQLMLGMNLEQDNTPVEGNTGEEESAGLPREDEEDSRRFEDLTMAFHRRVRAGYLKLALTGPRWTVVDASRTEEEVAQDVWEAVMQPPQEPPQEPPQKTSESA